MIGTPEEQFMEICEIEDIQTRMGIACAEFMNMKISAKTIRMLFDSLNNEQKIELLDMLYNKGFREKSMERLPPKILMPTPLTIESREDLLLWSTVLKYDLIREYETSKTEQQFYRFRNVIKRFNNSAIEISGNDYWGIKRDENSIKSMAVKGFIDELMNVEQEQKTKSLGLPSAMTIGVETEFVGPNDQELEDLEDKLKRHYGVTYLNDFEIKYDGSVQEKGKNPSRRKKGAEVVSPVLDDTEESWKKLRDACAFIHAIGGKVNKSCGGHIHIGENVLGVDKEAWKTLLNVWREAEPLIYMMSNRKGERTRQGAKRYAQMNTREIERIDWSFVTLKSEEDVEKLAREIHYGEKDRYKALNLTNLIKGKKNTIEFRLSNGTIDYDILRENILLYGRLVQMAKMHSIDPNRKRKQLELFFEHDLPEKEKMIRFLNLIFDSEEEKKVFYDRWESKVGDTPLFGENSIQTYIRQRSGNVSNVDVSMRKR